MVMNRKEKERRFVLQTSVKDWSKKPTLGGFEATCVKMPDGVELIKLPSEGIVKWDFMMYLAGKHNRRADEGFPFYNLEYEAHRVPTGGENKALYLCAAVMFGKKCAVCDWLKKHGYKLGSPKAVDEIKRTTTRHLWVVNDKPGDPKNKLKILDQNCYNKKKGFGEQMAALMRTLDENDNPFDPIDGSTFVITCEEDTFPGGKYSVASRIDLRPRKYSYPESIVEKAPCLDDCLVEPNYDEIWSLLEEGPTNTSTSTSTNTKTTGEAGVGKKKKDEDDDDKPTKSKKRPPDDEDDETEEPDADDEDEDEDGEEDADDGEDDEEGGSKTAKQLGIKVGSKVKFNKRKYTVLRVSSDGTLITLEDEDELQKKNINPNDVELLDDEGDDDEEDKPKAKPKAKPPAKKVASKHAADDDDDDEDDTDDDEDDD